MTIAELASDDTLEALEATEMVEVGLAIEVEITAAEVINVYKNLSVQCQAFECNIIDIPVSLY